MGIPEIFLGSCALLFSVRRNGATFGLANESESHSHRITHGESHRPGSRWSGVTGPGRAPLRAVPGLSPPRSAPLPGRLRGRDTGRAGAEAAPGAGHGPGRGRGGAGRGQPEQQEQEQRHAVRGAGHQPAGRAAAAGAGADPVRRRRRDPGQTGGAGERDGAERAGHGAVGLGRALCPAGGVVHRRGGHGGAEQGAQRPLLRCPDGAAGPGPRADCHPLLPCGGLADWQEQDSHDIPVILGAAAGAKPG